MIKIDTINRKEAVHYLLKLKAWLENNPNVKVHFGVEIRFVKADDIWISPCYMQDSCYINILMFKLIKKNYNSFKRLLKFLYYLRPYGKEYSREEWWKINEELMIECNGRPHWAKQSNLVKKDYIKLYPKFEDFVSLRKKLDPNDIFINEFLKKIFY